MQFLQDLFSHSDSQRAHEQIYGGGYREPRQNHKSSFTHELIAGGAGFAGEFLFLSNIRQANETDDCADYFSNRECGPAPYGGPSPYGGPDQYDGAGAYGNN
ncbi:unnamed protein product [Rotaria socialis]|uniref:Uncharacterized protein n=1 Tax=Rotaria socialis TaxID=392032 RepID=A0A818ZEZ7_9BILA|nr:unnamed protein product [Rotaria socialis]CAF3763996.1 unnamed protein product [Rotaria socialis]CAF4442301.1 unnamed protein product [Rotaria socialis]CAF4485091.1 unnamed protein product [Rotaria socialis]CAF4843947.1 unnamed protein product [Rotaria socialis]